MKRILYIIILSFYLVPFVSASDEKENGYSYEYLPKKAVAARYPSLLLSRGISGTCEIKYTVTKTGSTKDHEVVECTHKGFIKPSIAAIKKFEYEPLIVNGHPVEVTDMTNKFTFEVR